jgi:hypothetical protein
MARSLLVLVLAGAAAAQPPGKPDSISKMEAEESQGVAKKRSAELTFLPDKDSDAPLKLVPEPVFRWTEVLERRFYGDVFVWTKDGRPEVIASITCVFGPRNRMETEIHSLSTGRPVMDWNGRRMWQPESPGVELKPVPGAPKPAATPAARLQQMKMIASQFSLKADYGSQKWDLRVLRSPLYRYQSDKQEVLDGALFAYAQGETTDPEAFLVLEARGGKEKAEWQYDLVRFNGHCALRALHNDKEVWKVDFLPLNVILSPKRAYFSIRADR